MSLVLDFFHHDLGLDPIGMAKTFHCSWPIPIKMKYEMLEKLTWT